MSSPATTLTSNKTLLAWVEQAEALCQPAAVHWCDGSDEEYLWLCVELVRAGTFIPLIPARRP